MINDRDKAKGSLHRTQRICKMCTFVSLAISVLVLIGWIPATYSLATSLLESFDIYGVWAIFSLVVFPLSCITFAIFFVSLGKIFSDVAKGISPFSPKQVKRLRCMSALLMVHFVLQAAASWVSVQLQQIGVGTGFIVTGAETSSLITLDFTTLLFSAIFFALSYVFEYGILLQELSDDTLGGYE